MSEQPIMLGNRYRLDEVIGRGGMAEVWRAWDTRIGRDVAVKRLRADLATDPTFQARFQREAQSAGGLNHPNIVAVYDTGAELDPTTGVDIPYIVMELVQGTTLRDLLRDGRQILPERALEFTAGVLDALAYAHRRGIVHRDIKPANVMLTTNGRIKVMDFGIARAVSETSATMTQTAAVIGTAQYLSPEQARGETVDARSDIYSVGCLLYELLTSRPPFVGDSPVSVAYQHVREQPVPPSHIDPELTPDMDVVVLTALAKNPADRYQTAEAMRDDVQRLLDGEAPLGVASVPVEGDSTRVLSDRPAPGAHPRRGFVEATPVPVGDAGAAVPTSVLPTPNDPFEDDAETADMLPVAADAEPGRRRLGPLWFVLIALAAVLVVSGGGFALYQYMKPPPEPTTVAVPALINRSEADARQALNNAQLSAVPKYVNGPADTQGQVIDQEPAADTQVQIGSSVTFTVNNGPQMGKIPDGLIGLSESDARKQLAVAGFTNVPAGTTNPLGTASGRDEPIDYTAGMVLYVTPLSGTTCPLDTEVSLVLASGKSPVPDLSGMTKDDATQYAASKGFQISATTQETDQYPDGTVFQQRPAPVDDKGNPVFEFRNNRIYITVAAAPPPPPPPPPTETPTVQPTDGLPTTPATSQTAPVQPT